MFITEGQQNSKNEQIQILRHILISLLKRGKYLDE